LHNRNQRCDSFRCNPKPPHAPMSAAEVVAHLQRRSHFNRNRLFRDRRRSDGAGRSRIAKATRAMFLKAPFRRTLALDSLSAVSSRRIHER
jgi:hypothetical protein